MSLSELQSYPFGARIHPDWQAVEEAQEWRLAMRSRLVLDLRTFLWTAVASFVRFDSTEAQAQAEVNLALIRFGGHLPRGGYDVQNGITQGTAPSPATVL